MLPALADNPFFILGLAPDCRAIDVETQGQKWLGMLALDLTQAKTYATPVGPQTRDAQKVRWAMTELRDPRKRLVHEFWAQLPARTVEVPDEVPDPLAPFPQVFRFWGWRR